MFDKVFRENIEPLFFSLMRNVFGLKIKSATQLNEKMQITIEREMDFLFLIESESSEKFYCISKLKLVIIPT